MLREAEARDHAVFIDLLASSEVRTYLGGPRPRGELERELPETPGQDLGMCVVQLDGAMTGQVILSRAVGERGTGKAPRREAGIHRSRAVPRLGRRAVVRHAAPVTPPS